MLAARDIPVSHETNRQWGLNFGLESANRIRRHAPRSRDKWHLDEVVITIACKKHWLWRAVEQEGFVLDVLIPDRCDKESAKRPLAQADEETGSSASYANHRQAEKLRRGRAGDHARRRASAAQGPQQLRGEFTLAGTTTRADHETLQVTAAAQRVPSIHDQIANVFSCRPNQDTAIKFRSARNQAFATWDEITGVAMAA
jgi:putative transposase